jgi:hypothetical protein
MRVELKISGGLAYFPGLSRPIVIDSETLPYQQANELRRLLDKVHFFDLPPVINAPSRGAADYRQYTITVDDGNKHHVVKATDPVENSDLQALLNYLQAHR